jgi:hypothetical protein
VEFADGARQTWDWYASVKDPAQVSAYLEMMLTERPLVLDRLDGVLGDHGLQPGSRPGAHPLGTVGPKADTVGPRAGAAC